MGAERLVAGLPMRPRSVWLCPDSCHIALGERHTVAVGTKLSSPSSSPMTELGTGIVDWRGWADTMSRTPGAGTVLVELDEAADPVAALRAETAVAQQVRA